METIIFTIFIMILICKLNSRFTIENLALRQQLAIMKQSIRRDCLNHIIVLNEKHLKSILSDYFEYYHRDRTHLGLSKDTPYERQVQFEPENSILIALPRDGGLHHRYEWQKAA